MNHKQHADIIIAGAGVVGLIAALLAAKNHFQVTVVDRATAPQSLANMPMQARTIALNQATLAQLDALDMWRWIDKKRLGFMDHIRVYDHLQSACVIDTDSVQPLSVVIEYAHLQWALMQACLADANITVTYETSISGLLQEDHAITVRYQDGSMQAAKLLLGADGARSWLVDYLKMPLVKESYHHIACFGLARCEKPMQHTAVQICDPNYILGMLPLNDPHLCSIIYSCKAAEQQALMQANKAMQDCQLTNASLHQLGMLTWESSITSVPLMRQHLETYVDHRVVMVGDAAHRVHPLAGQGANMGIADVQTLMQVLAAAQQQQQDIGKQRLLKSYMLQQKPRNSLMLALHDALKEGLTDNHWVVEQCRKLGFSGFNKSRTLQKLVQNIIG